MNWSVYIVECRDGTLYTGSTNNIVKRILKHNSGAGAKYTKSRRPVKLLWSQLVGTRSDACKLEYKIKKMKRSQKLKLITEHMKVHDEIA